MEYYDFDLLTEALQEFYKYGNHGATQVFYNHGYLPSEKEKDLIAFAIKSRSKVVNEYTVKLFNRVKLFTARHIEMMNDGSQSARFTMEKIMKEDIKVLIPIYDHLFDEDGEMITKYEMEYRAEEQKRQKEQKKF